MSDQAPTTPDTVVVPRLAMKTTIADAIWRYDNGEFTAARVAMVKAQDILTAARPAATPGGEREDSAFKIASDLHAAYEQLIYGLPKYLEAENLTDEENMIREAYVTLDVTAHRLAALSRPAPVAGEAVAWRVRPRGDSKWNLWDENPVDLSPDRFEVEPLYATPTPDPAAARGGEDMDWQSVAMWMGFAVSAIKSGEAWSAQCQQHYDEAKAAFARLNAPALSAKGGS